MTLQTALWWSVGRQARRSTALSNISVFTSGLGPQTDPADCNYCRKVHGKQLDAMKLTSGECFVLEMIIDNLKTTPTLVTMFLDELEHR